MEASLLKCNYCHKEEELYYFPFSLFMHKRKIKSCDWCGKPCCSDCAKEESDLRASYDKLMSVDAGELLEFIEFDRPKYICPNCLKEFESKVIHFNDKCRVALDEAKNVEIVSINYEGKKHTFGDKIKIETDYYDDKKEALEVLKNKARYLGCDIVIETELHKESECEETESGGEYWYSTWSYSGVATHKRTKFTDK